MLNNNSQSLEGDIRKSVCKVSSKLVLIYVKEYLRVTNKRKIVVLNYSRTSIIIIINFHLYTQFYARIILHLLCSYFFKLIQ